MIGKIEKISALGLEFDTSAIPTNIELDPTVDFDNTPRYPFSLAGCKMREVSDCFEDFHESAKIRWLKRPYDYRPDNLNKHEALLNSWQPASA
jgi:hypothetical protein